MRRERIARNLLLVLAVLVATAVFIFDNVVELGVAVGVMHLLALTLVYYTGSPRLVVWASLGCSILVIGGLFASPQGGEDWKVVCNRALSLFAIWMMAALSKKNLSLASELRDRAEMAEDAVAENERRQDEQRRRSRAMASIMEDLRHKSRILIVEIEERKRMEAALRQSEEHARSIVDSALDAVVAFDEKGLIVDWNPQASVTFGWSQEDALGREFAELVLPKEVHSAHQASIREFLETGMAQSLHQRLELSAQRKSGVSFPIELAIAPSRTSDGWQFSCFIRDITQRLKSEADNQRFAAIVESTEDAIISESLDGIVTSWNPGATRLFGYSAKSMIGRPISVLNPPDREAEAMELMANLREDVKLDHLETMRLREDGSSVTVSLTVSPIRGAHGRLIGAATIARDISELKRAQRRFQSAVESAPVAMVMINVDGRIVLVNNQTELLFGYDRDELLQLTVEDLIPARMRGDHPQHRARFFMSPVSRQMGIGRDLYGLRKNGSDFPIEIGLSPIETDEGLFVLSAIVDITERKRSEEQIQDYAQQLKRSNEELDQFAYSASHDLKAPLRSIDNLAQWLCEDLEEQLPTDSLNDLTLMQQRIDRMERLLDDLLEYSRVGRAEHQLEDVDTEEMVRDIIHFLDVPTSFQCRVEPLPRLNVFRAPLEQVFRNLIHNALKHHDRPNGRIDVSAAELGELVEFTVSDDGPGIPADYHEQVFGMFKTLRPRDEVEGSGMGLALVKKIVERQGGQICLENSPAGGAIFRFTWPRDQRSHHTPCDGELPSVREPGQNSNPPTRNSASLGE